eukprot:scaffold532104_cov41-Prasinocladus_malaysianus.AAC.1
MKTKQQMQQYVLVLKAVFRWAAIACNSLTRELLSNDLQQPADTRALSHFPIMQAPLYPAERNTQDKAGTRGYERPRKSR